MGRRTSVSRDFSRGERLPSPAVAGATVCRLRDRREFTAPVEAPRALYYYGFEAQRQEGRGGRRVRQRGFCHDFIDVKHCVARVMQGAKDRELDAIGARRGGGGSGVGGAAGRLRGCAGGSSGRGAADRARLRKSSSSSINACVPGLRSSRMLPRNLERSCQGAGAATQSARCCLRAQLAALREPDCSAAWMTTTASHRLTRTLLRCRKWGARELPARSDPHEAAAVPGDAVEEIQVLRRSDLRVRRREHAPGSPSCFEGAFVRSLVDPCRASGDDDDVPPGKLAGEAGGVLPALVGGATRADDGDGARRVEVADDVEGAEAAIDLPQTGGQIGRAQIVTAKNGRHLACSADPASGCVEPVAGNPRAVVRERASSTAARRSTRRPLRRRRRP